MNDALLKQALSLQSQIRALERAQQMELTIIKTGSISNANVKELFQDGFQMDTDIFTDAVSRQTMRTIVKLGQLRKEWEQLGEPVAS